MASIQDPTAHDNSVTSTEHDLNQTTKQRRRGAQGVSKVKTGCTTCKIRRVKCDEFKPDCKRCTSTGRKCDGYAARLTIINGCFDAPRPLNSSSPHRGHSIFSPTYSFQGTYEERRAFELFRTRAVFQISGDSDNWFWNSLLLQATHREAAVRHAVLALSLLCEQHEVKHVHPSNSLRHPNKAGTLALQQYNSAIAELTTAASQRQLSVDVCLMTCILFASFEVIREHHGSAMLHITSGANILTEALSSSNGTNFCGSLRFSAIPYVDLETFQVMFNRLNSEAIQIAGFSQMQICSVQAPLNALGFCEDIPRAFRSIEEARNSFEFHSTQCIRLLNGLGPNPCPAQLKATRNSIKIFRPWQNALQAFIDCVGDSLSTSGKQAARVMQINRMFLVMNIHFATSKGPLSDMHWDLYLEDFKQMVLMANEIVEQNEADLRKDSQTLPKFTIGMNIIAPLYATASYCRHPFVRREAVALLRRSHNQQGLWNANIAARVCEKIIEIEEAALGQITHCIDVPQSARVGGVKTVFDSEGRLGAVAFRRKPSHHASETGDYRSLFTVIEDRIDTGTGFMDT